MSLIDMAAASEPACLEVVEIYGLRNTKAIAVSHDLFVSREDGNGTISILDGWLDAQDDILLREKLEDGSQLLQQTQVLRTFVWNERFVTHTTEPFEKWCRGSCGCLQRGFFGLDAPVSVESDTPAADPFAGGWLLVILILLPICCFMCCLRLVHKRRLRRATVWHNELDPPAKAGIVSRTSEGGARKAPAPSGAPAEQSPGAPASASMPTPLPALTHRAPPMPSLWHRPPPQPKPLGAAPSHEVSFHHVLARIAESETSSQSAFPSPMGIGVVGHLASHRPPPPAPDDDEGTAAASAPLYHRPPPAPPASEVGAGSVLLSHRPPPAPPALADKGMASASVLLSHRPPPPAPPAVVDEDVAAAPALPLSHRAPPPAPLAMDDQDEAAAPALPLSHRAPPPAPPGSDDDDGGDDSESEETQSTKSELGI